jgi:hypothetical protein
MRCGARASQAADLQLWRLAVSVVHSRGMSLQCGTWLDGSPRAPFLIAPVFDLLNHSPVWPTPFTWDWSGEEGGDAGKSIT